MICGIKWWANISKNNAYRIIKKASLRVTTDYNTKREILIDGEPKTFTKYGKYKCWHVVVKKESNGYKLEVRGSLHKFYHGNNFGSFTGMEVLAALQGMYDLFEVEQDVVNIQNLEIGINMPVWFQVYPYLCLNLLYHKNRTREDGDLKGIGFVFPHDDYLIKIYQKEDRILRFEVRYTSQDKLRGFGIQTGADLHEGTIKRLAESLVPEFEQVIMKDGVDFFNEKNNMSGLTKKQLQKLYKYSSIGYQQDYRNELKKARLAGDKRKWNAIRRQDNRLHNLFISIIRDKKHGDQTHSKLEAMVKQGIKDFKVSWRENVTHSPFDKEQESETMYNIPIKNRVKRRYNPIPDNKAVNKAMMGRDIKLIEY